MNPDFIFYFFGFFIGASIGSFYYTLSLRILKYFYGSERKKYSFYKKLYILLTKPSSCPACGHPVSIATLLPVAGFFVSGKKCKYCGDAISVRYPLTESLFGFLFILLFFLSSNFLFSLFALCLFGHLLISMHTDFYFFSVDYENLPFILIFGIISNFLLIGTAFDNTDFFVLFGFSFFYFTIWFFYKKGIGLGDVFFAPVFAFIAGHPWWILFLNTSYISALFVAFITRKKGESIRNKPLPMGVYFSVGLVISFICKTMFLADDLNSYRESE